MARRIFSGRLAEVCLPLAIFAAGRLVSGMFLMAEAADQPALAPGDGVKVVEPVPASPGYWDVAANWDGQWYKSIAVRGYPEELPTDADGTVRKNEWAFYPLFPLTVRFLMWATGLRFEIVAACLSTILGALAVVLLHRWLLQRTTPFAAGAVIVTICAFPTSPVLQCAYTESLSLLLLVLAFRALGDRGYGRFAVLATAICFTRPIALPLAAVVIVHWFVRYKHGGRGFTLGNRVIVAFLVLLVAAQTVAWPSVAWLATGDPEAFFSTQSAWRAQSGMSLFAAGAAGQALDSFGGTVLLLLILGGLTVVVLQPSARIWGPAYRSWALGYTAYILLVAQPNLAVVRYVMLALVPWWPMPAAGPEQDQGRPDLVMRWLVLFTLVATALWLQHQWVAASFVINDVPVDQAQP